MPRLLSTLPMEKDGIFYGIFLIYIKISFYSNILQYSSIPALAPKQNERVTIQIHTRLPFKISPFTLVVAIANANRRGFFFFPPSFLSPPPSAPQPLRTRRHVFLHTLWAGSAYFPWEVGGASRASGGHPGSLSISAG